LINIRLIGSIRKSEIDGVKNDWSLSLIISVHERARERKK